MKTTTKQLSEKLAVALDAAGYEYETKFRYYIDNALSRGELSYFSEDIDFDCRVHAFAMCELWDMLPDYILGNYKRCILPFWVSYTYLGSQSIIIEFEYKNNPCDALANLILWCIENGHSLNLKKKD